MDHHNGLLLSKKLVRVSAWHTMPAGILPGIICAARVFAASTFLLAAFGKVFAFPRFVAITASLGWFPAAYSGSLSGTLVVLELIASGLLLSSAANLNRIGGLIGSMLSLMFIAVNISLSKLRYTLTTTRWKLMSGRKCRANHNLGKVLL